MLILLVFSLFLCHGQETEERVESPISSRVDSDEHEPKYHNENEKSPDSSQKKEESTEPQEPPSPSVAHRTAGAAAGIGIPQPGSGGSKPSSGKLQLDHTLDQTLKKTKEFASGNKKSATSVVPEEKGVIQLNARNFSPNISDGNVWLIEFYAPWCSHCVTFHATYQEVAHYFHGTYNKEIGDLEQKSARKVKVARVDGEAERALASRFGVYSYPSFFVVDGWSAYSFDGVRSRKALIDYATGKYLETSPLPFYSSPMGPIGLTQGAMIQSGLALADTFQWLQNKAGLSPLMAGGFMFGSAFIGCFLTIVFMAIVITPKAKLD